MQLFTPTLERLVALIRGRVRFSENFDAWHRDERQDFKRARCAFALGWLALLGRVDGWLGGAWVGVCVGPGWRQEGKVKQPHRAC